MTSQCKCASFSDKVLWAFRVCINAGQFFQWLTKDLGVPGSPFLSGTSASNFLQCFFRALQQHTLIMAKEQSTESKTESTVLPLYKTSTEIRRYFLGQEPQVKKNTVTLGNVPLPGDTVGFEKLLIYLFCFASHRALHVMLQFCLLRLRLHHSAAPVCLTVSLGGGIGLCIGTSEWGPREDPFQGQTVSSPASLQQHFLGKQ